MSLDFLVTSLIVFGSLLHTSAFAFLPQFVSADEPHPLARMFELSTVFMRLTFDVFVGYWALRRSIRTRVISRPRVLTWMRRAFAGAFVALGARLELADR